MINRRLLQLALRTRLRDTVVATTGSTSLSATSTGYARAAGSFVTDGFEPGMEITLVTGFSTGGNNQAATSQGRVITAVTASALTCSGTATEVAGSGRVITAGVPFQQAFENTKFTPVPNYPYLEEQLVPATHAARTMPMASAYAENEGLYVVTVYGLADKGIYAIERYADAIMGMFTPGTPFTLSDSTNARVPADLGPNAGAIERVDGGWSAVTISIPYLATSLNTIAA